MKVSSFIRRTTLAVMLCGATFLSVVQADHHEAQAQKDVVDTAAGPDKRARRSLRHKDGHSIGAVLVVAREGVEGGVTFVFRSPGQEVVFAEVLQPGTGLVCDDRHLLHHTTALQGGPTWGGWRDIFVLDFNSWEERHYGPDFERWALGEAGENL